MSTLIKKSFLFIVLIMLINMSYAWNIGTKGRVSGPTIHTTYFLTPQNSPFPVHAQANVGSFVNGTCQYATTYDLGTEMLATGDKIDIDAFKLKSVVGLGYSCITINYFSNQVVRETLQLVSDGVNYITSYPTTDEVTIL